MKDRTPDGRPQVRVPGREALRPPSVRRFYAGASHDEVAGGGFRVLLDGRPVRTPARRELVVPTEPLAAALAAEWARQGETIDPEDMALTRLVNTIVDAVSVESEAVRGDILAFAGSDLLCYRAEHPRELLASQCASWDPVLAWAERTLGSRLRTVAGIMPIAQPDEALQPIAAVLARYQPFRLGAAHVITTLTGSALLALAVLEGALAPDAAWAAAHVDEDHQIALWGEDAEAAQRRRMRRAEFDAAVTLAALAGSF